MSIRRNKTTDGNNEKGAGLLESAQSFKDEVKKRMANRRSSSSEKKLASKVRNVKTLSRSSLSATVLGRKTPKRRSSFSEGYKVESLTLFPDDNVSKVLVESRKVGHAVTYVKDVVTKNILQQLPGSVSVVLETVLELKTLLDNCLANQESSCLSSTFNQLYQSLAMLVRFSDQHLIDGLKGNEALEKYNLLEAIKAVNESLMELLKLSTEKLKQTKSSALKATCGDVVILSTPRPQSENTIPVSLVPLTAREQQILAETSRQLSQDRDSLLHLQSNGRCQSSDNLLHSKQQLIMTGNRAGQMMTNDTTPPPTATAKAPEKPALLRSDVILTRNNLFRTMQPSLPVSSSSYSVPFSSSLQPSCSQTLSSCTPSVGAFDDCPPPLPRKKRLSSYNNLTSVIETSSFTDPSNQCHSSRLTPSSDVTSHVLQSDLRTNPVDVLRLSPHTLTPCSQSPTSSAGGSACPTLSDGEDSSGDLDEILSLAVPMIHQDDSLGDWDFDDGDVEIGDIGDYDNLRGTQDDDSDDISHITDQINWLTLSINSSSSVMTPSQESDSTGEQDECPSTARQNECPSQDSMGRQVMYGDSHSWGNSPHTVPPPQLPEKRRGQSIAEINRESLEAVSNEYHQSLPPALPPKKKSVDLYVRMLSDYSRLAVPEDHRSARLDYSSPLPFLPYQYSQPVGLSPGASVPFEASDSRNELWSLSSCSETLSGCEGTPHSSSETFSSSLTYNGSDEDSWVLQDAPPQLPPKKKTFSIRGSVSLDGAAGISASQQFDTDENASSKRSQRVEIEGDHKNLKTRSEDARKFPVDCVATATRIEKGREEEDVTIKELEEEDGSSQLTWTSKEEGLEVRGGSIDALVVHATTPGKKVFMFQEAFLMTYRSFICSKELICKLHLRYNCFSHRTDSKRRLSTNTFSLLLRVVSELGTELDVDLLSKLLELICQLICDGQLVLAKKLRHVVLAKAKRYHDRMLSQVAKAPLSSYQLTIRRYHLTDFKTIQIAEQLTLVDADLFKKIEVAEVLLWSKEQAEELSPNLVSYTEHFNKVSFWCRSRILEEEEGRKRERCLAKFIQILRHLRKFNNYNSYLSILSALDSAPIRRLQWPKPSLQALSELCELIDSSSSFRTYRQALAETPPPCIPYIGLILQDLTFVHIGNADNLPNGEVNFGKRWQQFNILNSMHRFSKDVKIYNFKRNERILSFFADFNDYLDEEVLWHLSETYKRRGKANARI